ncbi:UPF0415 protein C7orf25 homolog [Macrosteles quadrilineatus]|uniref:UPF0415 protein C7orf25 homolog n=1 Tax=Macrosteles quadrilineatus TaxID=74068 RepID=UPI0023E31374|nr:UPF0415 protein C7orf25 homolog [Macrosteles quadrilineatus]
MEKGFEEMQDDYKTHISEGQGLLLKLKESSFCHVHGIDKLERKIKRDIMFLSETLQNNKMKKEHLVCSNLHFYKAIIDEAQRQECEAVLKTFSYKLNEKVLRLTVDIVSKEGHQWTKVIARNPFALHQIFKEGDAFGRRSLTDQAAAYMLAASQNLNLYTPPKVHMSFVNGVPEIVKTYLEKFSIGVEGQIVTIDDDILSDSDSLSSDSKSVDDNICDTASAFVTPAEEKTFTKLNLCVTTLIAYVSALTNGGCNCNFREPLLQQQAEWERAAPVKPLLDQLFEGKELVCCTAALDDFHKILAVVGGTGEKRRATEFLSRVTEVKGIMYPGLRPSGKIKRRSLEIFGTGHALEAPTVSANKGFLQAALQKGVKFAAIIHESRALTECKQLPDVDVS